MKVAVTDANIFIDLINLQLLSHFFNLGLQVHTTLQVIDELHDHQAEKLMTYHITGHLKVHELTAEEIESMYRFLDTKKLSDPDKTVLFIARKEKAMVLSSDGPARNIAKQKGIEVHGLVWLFDQLVDNNHISKDAACLSINTLLASNKRYREDTRMNEELNQRLQDWN